MKKHTKHDHEPLVPGASASGAADSGTPAADAAASGTSAVADDLTAEQIKELRDQAAKAAEYWDRLLREAANFDNFKKRAARERQDAVKYANEALLQKLIPIIDNFEMALAAAGQPENASVESMKKGVEMIHSLLKAALAEAGLQEIDATGQMFDPHFHDAVMQKETAEAEEGRVVQQVRKGYRFHDRLLRAAAVVVAKKPAA